MVFLKKKIFPKKKKFFLPFFYATFQCGRYGVFKKKLKYFFDPEKVKKRASKVAHNPPRPFYFTVQPKPMAHSPELIFHIMKYWDQTSVLLSVALLNMIKLLWKLNSLCVIMVINFAHLGGGKAESLKKKLCKVNELIYLSEKNAMPPVAM